MSCIHARLCMTHKASLFTHAYVTKAWFGWDDGIVTELKCVKNDFQEPYVMLKRSANTPLFDERFVNYGYNKVQLIEQLRYMGMMMMMMMMVIYSTYK